ncbi:cell division protein FtsA, partial [Escherichia coli]|nr:cell division protein FtsA [Escherichia coli]
ATSIGLLMESLSIRDKKTNSLVQEEVSVSNQTVADKTSQEDKALDSTEPTHNETVVQQNASRKPTIGQNILEKIKKFFEESE